MIKSFGVKHIQGVKTPKAVSQTSKMRQVSHLNSSVRSPRELCCNSRMVYVKKFSITLKLFYPKLSYYTSIIDLNLDE